MYIYGRQLMGSPSGAASNRRHHGRIAGRFGGLPAAGAISVVELGLAVLTSAKDLLFSGGVSAEPATARYVHSNTPTDLPIRTKILEFEIIVHHPRFLIGAQSFWFRLEFQYNGYDLLNVSVIFLRDKSSSLPSSTFTLRFHPMEGSLPADPVAKIMFQISGAWDPIGRGDISHWGKLLVEANGRVSFSMDSEKNWVRAGSIKELSDSGPPLSKQVETFLDVFFPQPGSDIVMPGTEEEIVGWYRRLPQNTREQIQAGSIPIQIYGYASRTGSVTKNRE